MTEDIQRTLGRIEGTVLGIERNLKELSDEFRLLESGRLTKLEKDFMVFQVETREVAKEAVEVAKKKAMWLGILTGAIVSIIVSVLSAYIIHLFIK